MNNWNWNIIAKVTHWLVALMFLSNHFITDDSFEIHSYFGYAIASLVGIRLLYGFTTSSRHHQIKYLFPSVGKIKHHLLELKSRQDSSIGHNALGAMAVLLMWFGLIGCAITGYLIESPFEVGDIDLENVHHLFVNSTLFVVFVHIIGVVFMSFWIKRNYIVNMLFTK